MKLHMYLLNVLVAALCLGSMGCDYVAEGFQDGVEDFVAEATRMGLQMLLPPAEQGQ